ncbi:flippase-like domain-containing protein [candidate division KSB1 bacterium]|nr:flippase-like domain-containing protein [candidate division KSB1 bacterium]
MISLQHPLVLRYLFLAVGLALLPWLTHTIRLIIWTDFLGQPVRFRESFRIVLATELGSSISPTAIGGGYIKLGMLVQKGLSPGRAASLMTLGTLEDFVFFAFAIPFAVWRTSALQVPVVRDLIQAIRIDRFVWILVAILCLWFFWRIIRPTQMGRRLRNTPFAQKARVKLCQSAQDFFAAYRMIASRGKKHFLLSLLLTAVQWISRYTVISALLAFFDLPYNALQFFLLQWIVFTLMTFVPTPGAAVGAEASFYLIYGAFVPREMLGIVTALWRFFTYYLQLSLGSLLLGYLNTRSGGDKKAMDCSQASNLCKSSV